MSTRPLLLAIRTLRRHRSFAVLVILSLSLGTALNTSIFAFLDAAVLRPLPFDEPVELYVVRDPRTTNQLLSDDAFRFLRDNQNVFERLGAYRLGVAASKAINVEVNGNPAMGVEMSANAFRVLGVGPRRGRVFVEDEETTRADVVVIGFALWQRAFDSRPDAVGEFIRINDRAYSIIGVMPRGFAFPTDDIKFWIPLRSSDALSAVGRVRANVGPSVLDASLSSLHERWNSRQPDAEAQTIWYGVSLAEAGRLTDEAFLFAIQAAVVFVFLIACVNTSNLALAHASARQQEYAVRLAIGASPRALLTEAFTESVVISGIATGIGFGLAYLLLHVLSTALPPTSFRDAAELGLSQRAVLYAIFCACVAAGIMFLGPRSHLGRVDVRTLLGGGGAAARIGGKTGRLRNAFVVMQFALSLILLASTALVVGVLVRSGDWQPGFEWKQLARLHLRQPSGTMIGSEALHRLAELPGIESVAGATSLVPVDGVVSAVSGSEIVVQCQCQLVSNRFLETLHIPVIAGRGFTSGDNQSNGLAIVDSVFARRVWGDRDAIGQLLRLGGPSSGARYVTVVGMSTPVDMRLTRERSRKQHPGVFVLDDFRAVPALTVFARARNIGLLLPSMRSSIESALPTARIEGLATLEDQLRAAREPFQWFTVVFSTFGGLALLLAAIGLYGVVAHTTTQRRQEIGVRLALGATPGMVRAMILIQSLRLVLLASVIGAVAAVASGQVLNAALFREPGNIVTSGAAMSLVVLMVTAVFAALIPAWRASRADPIVALRAH